MPYTECVLVRVAWLWVTALYIDYSVINELGLYIPLHIHNRDDVVYTLN